MTKIALSNHVIYRMLDREDWLNEYKNYREVRVATNEIVTKLKTKGIWYESDEYKNPEVSYYCIMNNLTVYCGILIEDDNTILLTTFYPYTQRIKRRWAGWDRYHFPTEA
jgi:hypothetical protein